MKYLYFLIVLCLPLINVWGQKSLKVTELQLDKLSQNHIKEKVGEYAIFKIDRDIFKSGSIASAAQLQLNIPNFKNFSFSLDKTKVRSSNYSQNSNGNRNGVRPTAETYGGYLENGNYVRLTIAPGFIYGIIEADKGFYVIDQLKYFLQDKNIEENNLIMYHTSEIYDQQDLCGLSMDNNSNYNEMGQDSISTASYDADCLILEIATDADYEYYQAFGSNTNNRILGDINNIQPLYEDSFGMELTVVFQNVWDNSNDPYNVVHPPQDVNDEIDSVWQNHFSHVKRDVIHLFTGKTFYIFGGEVRGSADGAGTICQRETANSFTTNTYQSFGVVAHELGHNLGAIHGDADCDTSKSVMCVGIKSTPLYFSNNSIARIQNYINSNSSCLGKPEANLPQAPTICTSQLTFEGDYILPASSGADYYRVVSSSPYLQIDGQSEFTYTNAPISVYFTATKAGTYLVELFTTNACGTSRGAMYVTAENCSIGFETYAVYPNPASEEVLIEDVAKRESNTSAQGAAYPQHARLGELYDFSGNLVKTVTFQARATITRMEVSNLKAGLYFLKIQVGADEEVYKIIVAH